MHTNIQTIVTVKCLDQVLQLINAPRITSGGVNDVRAEFEFCPLWDGLAKSAVFYTDPKNVYKQVLEEDACDVPPEVLAVPGLMYMGVFGVNAAGDVVRTSGVLVLNIEPGAITEATAVSDPTPELYQQILAEVQKAREAAEEANPVDVDLTGAPLEYVAVLEDEDGDPIPTNAVTYDEQSLTDEQKAQARANIGAATAAEAKAAAAAAATAALEQAKASGEFDGANGKSAYQYAVDAGYTGTEEEFAKVLASGGYAPETETVLSDNLLDKSLMTKGGVWYYGSSGIQLAGNADSYSYYGYIPLRGAGTYRTKFQAKVHESTSKRIALVNDNNEFVANAIGSHGEIPADETRNWLDFEFVVTQEHIAAGATKVAFDVYSLYFDQTMIVKDREYPSEFIPFGYIEVATDSGRKQNNVLCEKTAVFLGDSLCAGTTVGTDSPYYNYGWGGIIGEANRMNWKNYGKNGGTITHRGADGTCIAKIADTAIAEHPNADYVIFEGGCNDADQMRDAGLGEISADYATFDTTTFSGALEALILKLVTAYPNAKIGYIIPQKMYKGYSDYTAKNHIHRKYFDRAVEICQKWGIPVVDIWNGSMLNPKLSTASIYYVEENGQHLTETGYLAITPMIEAWMRNLYVPGMVAVAGSNPGGVTSWNDLTDKPFGESDNAVVLQETQFVSGIMDGALATMASGVELVEGKTYTVNWNGVEYETVCFMGVSPLDGSPMPMVGNPAALGGEDNNLPFAIGGNEQGVAAVPLDGSTSAIVSITGYAVVSVPTKYVPYALPYYIELDATSSMSASDPIEFTCFDNVANVSAIILSGRSIYARYRQDMYGSGNVVIGYYEYTLPLSARAQTEANLYGDILMFGNPTGSFLIFEPQANGTYLVGNTLSD